MRSIAGPAARIEAVPFGELRTLGDVVVSFHPSGHALEDVMILGMLSVRLWRSTQAEWLKVVFPAVSGFLCVLIGIARVALNVHYPSDIAAGAVLGTVCGSAAR